MLSEDGTNIARCKENFESQVADTFGHSICENTFDAAMSCVQMMQADVDEAQIKQTAVKTMLGEAKLMI